MADSKPPDGASQDSGPHPEVRRGTVPSGSPAGPDGGCLVAAIRLPLRVVALIVVLPLRLLWDALCALGRAIGVALRWTGRSVLAPVLRVLVVVPMVFLWRYGLRPVLLAGGTALVFLARYGLVWSVVAAWRYICVPVGIALTWLVRVLLVIPLVFAWSRVVVPLARGVRAGVTALWRKALLPFLRAGGGVVVLVVRYGLIWPLAALWRHVCVPVGRGFVHGIAALWRHAVAPAGRAVLLLLRVLVVVPLVFLWNRITVPVAREAGAAVAVAWRVAGRVSRAVGRAIGLVFVVLVVVPLVWAWRRVRACGAWFRRRIAAPALRAAAASGRWVRTELLHPVALAVEDARRTVRTALFGVRQDSRPPAPRTGEAKVPAPLRKEPGPDRTRR